MQEVQDVFLWPISIIGTVDWFLFARCSCCFEVVSFHKSKHHASYVDVNWFLCARCLNNQFTFVNRGVQFNRFIETEHVKSGLLRCF